MYHISIKKTVTFSKNRKEFYRKLSNDKNYRKVKDHCYFKGK